MEYLYHGSVVQELTILEPRKRYTPSESIEFSAVYATPLAAFAVTHVFPWSSEDGFDVVVKDRVVTLICPKLLQDKLNVPISIYTLPVTTFVLTTVEETGYTWHSTQSVEVIEELKFNNVNEGLKYYGAVIQLI